MRSSIQRALERLLNLRRGDLGRGALLFAYLFLIISTYVVGQVVRDALFLGRYRAAQLPYADLAILVAVGIVIAAYIRIGRRLSQRSLLIGTLLAFAASGIGFWWVSGPHAGFGTYLAIYVWVGVFGVLGPAQVWTLASEVLSPREAKRLYGVLGAGATLGGIFGGFVSSAAAQAHHTEQLLLGMVGALVGCAVIVFLVWRQALSCGLATGDAFSVVAGDRGPRTLKESVEVIRSMPYLRAIAGVIGLSSLVTAVAGWQFKAMAKDVLQQKDALAVFFGNFNAYVGVLSLALQALVTSRVLKRYGLGTVLFILPVTLCGGSAALLLLGSLWAALLLKSSEKVIRYSIDRPAVELLYLPLPSSTKIQVKSFIDTVVWRLGDGLAGLTVLLFATFGGYSPRQMSWVNLAFIAGWLAVARVARRRYVAALRESIQQHRLDVERETAPVLDRSATDILASKLDAVDPQEILYALSLFGVGRQQAAHPAVRGLLAHPSPEVRQQAVAILSAAGDRAVLPAVERLLRDPSAEVRTEALLYLSRHADVDPVARLHELGDFPDFSIQSAVVAVLARSGESEKLETARLILDGMLEDQDEDGRRSRREAARMLGSLPNVFPEALERLVHDPDPDVAAEAIAAARRLKSAQVASALMDRLGHPRLGTEAAEALAASGGAIVPELRARLADGETPVAVRREIPDLLARVAKASTAAAVLADHLLEADTTLRFRVIAALNKLIRDQPEVKVDTALVETALAAEIVGHYRSYQIVGTLGPEIVTDDGVGRGLQDAMANEVERIFRLLALLYPRLDFKSAHLGLQSQDRVVHDHALDFLDNVLKPGMRSLLVPLLDGEVSAAERVQLANRLVGVVVGSRDQAVAALAGSGDPWLKSCAAYAIGTLGLRGLEHELDAWLEDPDPLLRETVRQAKARLRLRADGTAP
jgi:ATP:ADP antiporter, AAA family